MTGPDSVVTPERPQYIVYWDHHEAPGKYSVRFFDGSKVVGIQKAAHDNLEAVRVVIPTTHAMAPFRQLGRMIEVWVLKEFVDDPAANQRAKERYPRGWHPDRDY